MLLEGRPLRGKELQSLKDFLQRMGLQYDDGIEYSACILNDNYEIIGTGSVEGNVIKCVAVDPACRGQGISAEIISNLVQYEFEKARTHILIYTKPENKAMFGDMGFYTIFETDSILFMENRSRGFVEFLENISQETPANALDERHTIGAVVANCNPFTLGHQYLIEQSLKQCDYLHLFILSDNRSYFSADERFEMVRRGTAHLERVILHRTQDYMISAATFPTYFFKDRMQGQKANCMLDLELFAARIAPQLRIAKRFVGSEPYCTVTKEYNDAMKEVLPHYGIEVVELERHSIEREAVSASDVRRCLENKEWDAVRMLVPESSYEYLCGNK